jgi:hypothetical protein
LDRYACAAKDGSPSENFMIFDDDSHNVIVSRGIAADA